MVTSTGKDAPVDANISKHHEEVKSANTADAHPKMEMYHAKRNDLKVARPTDHRYPTTTKETKCEYGSTNPRIE